MVGVGVPALLGLELFAVLGVYLAFPLTVGAVSYLVFSPQSNSAVDVTNGSLKPFITGFTATQALGIVLLVTTAVRPLAYYFTMALGATFVFVQILRSRLTPTRVGVVLVQCIALLGNLLWGVTFKYEFFFGRTDLFPHTWYAEQLLQTGHVTDAFENYEAFPLWHLLGAIEHLYMGVDIPVRYLFFFTNGIAYAALLGGMYLLTHRLLDSRRIALTAVLLTAINPWVLIYGMYSIPRSVVSVLSVFALLAMFADGWRSSVMFVLLTVGIVMYHTVSVPYIFIVFGTFYVIQNLSEPGWVNSPLHIRDLFVVAFFQTLYWVFAAPDLLAVFMRRLTSASISGSTGAGGTGTQIPHPVNELFNYLQFSLLLLFVVIAVVVALRSSRLPRTGKVAVLSGAIVSVVTYPGPTLLIGKLASNFNLIRFGQYTFPFIVIAGAVGVVVVADGNIRVGGPRAMMVFRGLAIVLVFSLAFLAVSNDFVASDNPTVEREFYTYYLTEGEIAGYETVADFSSKRILTDELACKYVTYSDYGVDCTILQTDNTQTRLLTGETGIVVLRTGELHRRALRVLPTKEYQPDPAYDYEVIYLSSESEVWGTLGDRSKVLAGGEIAVYLNTSSE